jgi:uncharacterized protein (UPF0179 family)
MVLFLKITLIGKSQAKVGHKFIFTKNLIACSNCNLKQICTGNLDEGRIYEIINIRPKEHPCDIYEENVVVIEVELAKIKTLIDSKVAFEGATITFKPIELNNVPEDLMEYAEPPGIRLGDKCKIIKIFEDKKIRRSKLALVQLELTLDSF